MGVHQSLAIGSTDTFNFYWLNVCLTFWTKVWIINRRAAGPTVGEQWMRLGLFRKSGLSCHSVTWHTRGDQAQEPKGGLYWSRPKCISAALWFVLTDVLRDWLRLRPGLQAIMNRIDAGCQTTDHRSAPQSKPREWSPVYISVEYLCVMEMYTLTHTFKVYNSGMTSCWL